MFSLFLGFILSHLRCRSVSSGRLLGAVSSTSRAGAVPETTRKKEREGEGKRDAGKLSVANHVLLTKG